MDLTALLIFLAIGALAGWMAGLLMRGTGLGLAGDMVVGVIGAFIAGWLFSVLGIAIAGRLGLLIAAVVGAVVLLAGAGVLNRSQTAPREPRG